MHYKEIYEKWLESPYLTEEDKERLRRMTGEEIHEAFYKTAEFGTGGMRGIMGLGTNRLNRYMIRLVAKGLADMVNSRPLKDEGLFSQPVHKVVVAYDTRNSSAAFAEETARVLAANGIRAYLFDRPSPVPLLSFAIRDLNADGGVVITASHNTKEYNGFKAYDDTGCQMLPDMTAQIAASMAAIEDPLAIEVANMDDAIIDTGLIVPTGQYVVDRFLEAISSCGMPCEDEEIAKAEASKLKVYYTPLHGSGRDYVMDALRGAGFKDAMLVTGQDEYDGDFPTLTKPNPEDSAALEMAVNMAFEKGADLVIGTDPDCDRVGAAVINSYAPENQPKATYITGNQMGVLLIDYLCRLETGRQKTDQVPLEDRNEAAGARHLITTIVTSALGPIIAKDHGIDVSYVLTGFKYIGDMMNEMEKAGKLKEFFMGYEESYGYLMGPHARDKDGVGTALTICRMAAYHKARGKSLVNVLNDIYMKYGFWFDSQESFVFEGSEGEETMKSLMKAFREMEGRIFGGFATEVRYDDLMNGDSGLPKADVLKYLFMDGSWVAIRPSGTEPKIKVYYCIRGDSAVEAAERQTEASACIHRLTDMF